jgi:hypothetical protein
LLSCNTTLLSLFISSSSLLSCNTPSRCVGYLFFLSSSWFLSCNMPLGCVCYLFFLSSCWILTSFPFISSILYASQCSRITMRTHYNMNYELWWIILSCPTLQYYNKPTVF